jgi:hypothetical protein
MNNNIKGGGGVMTSPPRLVLANKTKEKKLKVFKFYSRARYNQFGCNFFKNKNKYIK